jgi:iron complex transport system substrate-binding protein
VVKLLAILLLAGSAFAQPRRIVSLAPSATEMLYALGLGDRVVGVTTFCRYPPEAARKPKIGNYLRPDVETILALRPDLVVAEKSMIRQALSLPRLKLNVLEVDDSTIQGIYESIRAIGRATGAGALAESLCQNIRAGLEDVRRRAAPLGRPRVMFVVGRTPGRIEDLIAAGGPSYLNEVIEIAGGENIFKDAATAYAKVGLEEVLARDPEVIIDMGEMAQTEGVTESQKRAVVALWRRYPNLKAVRSNRVFAVASDVLVVPGPRVAAAAAEVAGLLHAGFGK